MHYYNAIVQVVTAQNAIEKNTTYTRTYVLESRKPNMKPKHLCAYSSVRVLVCARRLGPSKKKRENRGPEFENRKVENPMGIATCPDLATQMLLKKTIKTNVGLSHGKFTFEPSGLVIYFLRDF